MSKWSRLTHDVTPLILLFTPYKPYNSRGARSDIYYKTSHAINKKTKDRHSRRYAIMHQNGTGTGWQYRDDSRQIWHNMAYLHGSGLTCIIYSYMSHDADTHFTHCWHLCDKKLINQRIRHGNTRNIHFQEISSRFNASRPWWNGQHFANLISKSIFQVQLIISHNGFS